MKTELPEAELVRRTFTIREMDIPIETRLTKKGLLRWLALSLGLLSEKESRQTVLEVLDAILTLCIGKGKTPTTEDIMEYIKKKTGQGISSKLTRYHLGKLIELKLIRRKKNQYSINNAPEANKYDLKASFQHWVTKDIQETLSYTENVMQQLGKAYKK
jgi:hypothetical protein